jgi:hypothetical protein
MNQYQHFGLEIDLISEYELLEAIELSAQLPWPVEQSIFSLKDPNDWLLAGEEVRRVFREELPVQLSELGSAFLLHVLQEHGEGYSDLMVEWEETSELTEFLTGPYWRDVLQLLHLDYEAGSFRQVRGREPFFFIHVSYDRLLELELPDWEATLPSTWQALIDEEADPLPLQWLREISETISDLQVMALERDGTPSLFMYPVVFPELVYEVEEDEPPHQTLSSTMRWLRSLELGDSPLEIPADPYLRYQVLRYLEQQAQRIQQILQQHDYESLQQAWQNHPRSIRFAEGHAFPDFLGQPRELIISLLTDQS